MESHERKGSGMTTEQVTTCRHCGRRIVNEGGRWIDPDATGDDSVWRETCDSHDTFVAEHEPESVGMKAPHTDYEVRWAEVGRDWLGPTCLPSWDQAASFANELPAHVIVKVTYDGEPVETYRCEDQQSTNGGQS